MSKTCKRPTDNYKVYRHPEKTSSPEPVTGHRAPAMRTNSSQSSCPACEQAEHSLYICPVFKSWSLDRKKAVIKKVKVCFNCLSIGHLSGSCPSRKSCRQCGGRHHTLLHSEMTSPPTTNRQSEFAPAASTTTNQAPSIL